MWSCIEIIHTCIKPILWRLRLYQIELCTSLLPVMTACATEPHALQHAFHVADFQRCFLMGPFSGHYWKYSLSNNKRRRKKYMEGQGGQPVLGQYNRIFERPSEEHSNVNFYKASCTSQDKANEIVMWGDKLPFLNRCFYPSPAINILRLPSLEHLSSRPTPPWLHPHWIPRFLAVQCIIRHSYVHFALNRNRADCATAHYLRSTSAGHSKR